MPSIIMTHCKQYFEILFYVTFVFTKEKIIITIKGLNGVSTNFLLIIILLILVTLSIFINI